MSQFCLRLLATVLLLGQACLFGVLGATSVEAATGPNTWEPLSALPQTLQSPVLALAVDPANQQLLIAGTQSGAVYRSTDGGAHWTRTGQGMGHAVTSLVFDPAVANLVLAGTTGAGIWTSTDEGTTWSATPTTQRMSIRALTVNAGILAAGTQHGILLSHDGTSWTSIGLDTVNVSALTIVNAGAQPAIVAGGDGQLTGQALPLYLTPNGGASWTSVASTVSGSTMVSALLTLPSGTVLLGTNGGLFASTDGGQQWAADNAGGALPPVDVTSLAAGSTDGNTFYVASDGGASASGGIWVTRDAGATFTSLRAPQAAVTGLAAVAGPAPLLYAAAFKPSDDAVSFWNYSDAGGTPMVAPLPTTKPAVGAGNTAGAGATVNWVRALSQGPEMPFLILSAMAVLVLVVALGAYARSARRL